jgi:hypothetical protein
MLKLLRLRSLVNSPKLEKKRPLKIFVVMKNLELLFRPLDPADMATLPLTTLREILKLPRKFAET